MITQRDFRLPMINENDLKEENEIIKNNLYYKLKLQKKFSDKNHLISNSLLLPKINSSFKKQTIDSYRKKENPFKNNEYQNNIHSFRVNRKKIKFNTPQIICLKQYNIDLSVNEIDYSLLKNLKENDNINICFHLIKLHYLIEQNLFENEYKINQRLKILFGTYFFILKSFKGDLFLIFDNSLGYYFDKILKIQMCLFSRILFCISYFENIIKYEKIFKNISLFLYLIYINFLKTNNSFYEILNTIFGNEELKKFEEMNSERNSFEINREKETILNQLINKTLKKLKIKIKTILNIEIKSIGDAINSLLLSINRLNILNFIKIIIESIIISLITNESLYISKYLSKYSLLPPINSKFKYTLVLDLDETLEHAIIYKGITHFLVRPYVIEFLNNLKDKYEIIIFTAGVREVI